MHIADNKNDKANIDISEAERQFTGFVADVCGKLPSKGIVPDGKIHRFSTKDDGTDRDGAYQYWPNGKSGDGRPHGWAQDHHGGGDMLTWQYNGAINQRTPEQMKAAQEEAKQRQEEDERDKREARKAAINKFNKAATARADNPYLAKKQVGIHGNLKETDAGALLIPYADLTSEEIITIQEISPNAKNTKKFLCPMDKRPLAFSWGNTGRTGRPDFLLLAEGYATAASVYEALPDDIKARFAMFSVGSCYNLLNAATALRNIYIKARIIILADNDARNENNNPGINRAREVVDKGYADRYIYPTFTDEEVKDGKNDWNDYATIYGAEAVRDKIMSELFVESSTPDGLTIITPPAPAPAPEAEAPAKDTPKKKSLLEAAGFTLNEEEAEEVDMIGGLFPRGQYSMIFGEPGKGKTWIVLKTICDLSIGGEVLGGVGYSERPQRTLLYSGEAGRGPLNLRLKQTQWRYDPEKISIIDRRVASQKEMDIDIDKATGRKALLRVFDDLKKTDFTPDLFIIDSLSAFIDDETDRAAGRTVTAFLDRIANEKNCAVVVVHHSRKAKRTESGLPLTINDASGSGIFGRQAATIYAIEEKNVVRDGQEREEHIVRSVKSWYKKQKPFSYVLNSYTDEAGAERVSVDIYHDISIQTSEPKYITIKNEILYDVFSSTDDALTFADIVKKLKTKADNNTIRRALLELVDEKQINRTGNTRDTRYTLISK